MLTEKQLKEKNVITDGLGNYWEKKCPICKQNTVEIVRPGKADCYNYECGLEKNCEELFNVIFGDKESL